MTTDIAQESPIAEYRPTEAALADLRTKYEAVVYDVTDPKTMVLAKAARKELRDVRVALEAERVRIKAPSLQRSRDIDSEAKRITAEIEALEDPIDAQIKAEETRKQREKDEADRIERERVEKINARFDALKALAVVTQDFTVEQIESRIGEVLLVDEEGIPDDLKAAWTHEQRLATASLRASLDRRAAYDADQAELAKLRAAAAEVEAEKQRLAEVERQRAADEAAAANVAAAFAAAERIQQEAKEAAARAAEQAAIDQAAAVKDAEERATREAEARELERRADEARVAEEQRLAEEKRAARLSHRRKINTAAKSAVMEEGFSEEQAETIIKAIVAGRVPNITINY